MFSAAKTAGPSGYNLTNSLRFRSSASAYLNRTFATPTNNKIWTWSSWVKKSGLGAGQTFLGYGVSGTLDYFGFNSSDQLYYFSVDTGGTVQRANYTTLAVFRDPSAWYHVVFAIDTTQATASNRFKLYVNGVQQTLTTTTSLALNWDTYINRALNQGIGYVFDGGSPYFNGYMDEINFIDGQQLTPSSFGSTNATTGVWQPAKYSGTYGTNGFYLNFTDIALTSGSNAGLGKDFSGNGNYWTTNNISVTAGTTYDAMLDVPTNTSATVANYAVLNPLKMPAPASVSYTNGNLSVSCATANQTPALATIYPSSGKWYWEVTWTSGSFARLGVQNTNVASTDFAADTAGWRWESNTGNIYNGSNGTLSTVSTYAANDVLGFCLDLDSGKLYVSKNGTWQNSAVPASGTGAVATNIPTATLMSPAVATGSGTAVFAMNFGQRPFTYTPPTGFVRLNTFNLPDSTIVKGNTVMDAVLWTGAGQTGAASITGLNFKPDFVWAKMRSSAISHTLYNSIVGGGANKALSSNGTDTEASFNANATNGYLSSFDSNGFSYFGGSSPAYFSSNGNTYVGWAWQAGQGSTSSNTDGSVASTVSVNATAGFSVVTYTGTGVTNATVGHGLGVAAKMVIVKNRTTNATSNNWWFIHANLTAGNNLYLNTTTGQFSVSGATTNGGLGSLTSTTFTLASGASNSNNTNQSGTNYVAYCWAEIAGFSKFTSYTGNGSTDGPFIFLGFRPKYVLLKRTNSTGDWETYDTSRDLYNPEGQALFPNLSNAESSISPRIDLLSNGFKLRTSGAGINGSGDSYIVAAFAENPFKNALAR